MPPMPPMQPWFNMWDVVPALFMIFWILIKYTWPFLLIGCFIAYLNFKTEQRQIRREKEERQALLDMSASIQRMEQQQNRR